MSDPLRTDPASHPDGATGVEREAKIEELLLVGLDHYFAGGYEQAINVWTRVLFLDRGHARARAYIERARSALAERLRESEELLHGGVAAFNRGEAHLARRLLDSAIDRGGPNEVALALLARLNRLEAGASAPDQLAAPPFTRGRPHRMAERAAKHGSWGRVFAICGCAVLVGLSAFAAVRWRELAPLVWFAIYGPAGQPSEPVVRVPDEPLIVPRSAETALARARTLAAAGRLAESLRALELVKPADPLRAQADELKAEVQKQLLSAAGLDQRLSVDPPSLRAPPEAARPPAR